MPFNGDILISRFIHYFHYSHIILITYYIHIYIYIVPEGTYYIEKLQLVFVFRFHLTTSNIFLSKPPTPPYSPNNVHRPNDEGTVLYSYYTLNVITSTIQTSSACSNLVFSLYPSH